MKLPSAQTTWRQPIFVPRAVKKALAGVVITVCLAAQLYAILRPSGARWWPFVDYPMYSRSYSEGATFRVRELRVRTCEEKPRVWKVWPRTIGYQSWRYLGELSSIAADHPVARTYRSVLSRLVSAHVTPRPCALQVWERAVTVTREGVDVSSVRQPRWRPLREWRVDEPDSVRVLTRL
jgi:hypothetical protein